VQYQDWSFDATGHGLEDVRFRGTRVATRIFFSVRDLVWGSPRVTLEYGDDGAIRGEVDGYPLEVTGSVEADGSSLRLTWSVRATADTDVTRAGPCILSERSDLAPSFTAVGPDGAKEIELADRIVIERIATRFTELLLSIDELDVRFAFDGELFEMEDQRNWADSTFKTYCPPLADPQPIHFAAGDAHSFAITITALPGPAKRAVAEVLEAPVPQGGARVGILHPGGPLSLDRIEALKTDPPAYLHLLVDLSSPTWREELEADFGAAAALGVDSVLTVDVADLASLPSLATIAAGRASTVLLFDRGKSTTSPELAATTAFADSGIRIGGGTRSNFASLNAVGSVPAELEVIAVPLAVASHDDDDRALTSSIESFAAIIRDTRRIADGRDVLVGPVSFRPTFDSWGPPGVLRDPRIDWTSTNQRDGTEFAARWRAAALDALTAIGVSQVTIGSTRG
jgi:hypothetical protein